jgi:hypothetical protein
VALRDHIDLAEVGVGLADVPGPAVGAARPPGGEVTDAHGAQITENQPVPFRDFAQYLQVDRAHGLADDVLPVVAAGACRLGRGPVCDGHVIAPSDPIHVQHLTLPGAPTGRPGATAVPSGTSRAGPAR